MSCGQFLLLRMPSVLLWSSFSTQLKDDAPDNLGKKHKWETESRSYHFPMLLHWELNFHHLKIWETLYIQIMEILYKIADDLGSLKSK